MELEPYIASIASLDRDFCHKTCGIRSQKDTRLAEQQAAGGILDTSSIDDAKKFITSYEYHQGLYPNRSPPRALKLSILLTGLKFLSLDPATRTFRGSFRLDGMSVNHHATPYPQCVSGHGIASPAVQWSLAAAMQVKLGSRSHRLSLFSSRMVCLPRAEPGPFSLQNHNIDFPRVRFSEVWEPAGKLGCLAETDSEKIRATMTPVPPLYRRRRMPQSLVGAV